MTKTSQIIVKIQLQHCNKFTVFFLRDIGKRLTLKIECFIVYDRANNSIY